MTDHVVESTSELSAFMKAGVMAGSERDTGFSSGGDEDDMSGLHSPSASEDSVEVQVTPISLRNKRKLAEPRKIQETGSTAPPKKRRFERIEETLLPDEDSRTRSRLGSPSPFRPWSSRSNESKTFSSTVAIATTPATSTVSGIPATSEIVTVATTTLSPPSSTRTEGSRDDGEEFTEKAEISPTRPGVGLEPAGSFERDRRQIFQQQRRDSRSKGEHDEEVASDHPRLQEEPLSLVLRGEIPRVPAHPAVSGSYEGTGYSTERAIRASSTMDLPGPAGTAGPAGLAGTGAPTSSHHRRSNVRGAASSSSSSSCRTDHSRQTSQAGAGGGGAGGGGQQRNYKNMTRERRIEANARERTRVHTISAAFDTLRRAIPAYSHNQKLSKLSVLRIACSYIMTLGKIIGVPEEESSNGASLGACVDLVSRTIQTEGKLRKRKED